MITAADHTHYTVSDQLHILLAIGIMVGYLSIPFTALRKLPLTATTQVAGTFFFITCALTHLGIAAGFHNNPWMVLNDAVQLASVITFIVTLNSQVRWALKYREAKKGKAEKP